MKRVSRIAAISAAAVVTALLAACADSATSPRSLATTPSANLPNGCTVVGGFLTCGGGGGQIAAGSFFHEEEQEWVEVCKIYAGGGPIPQVTIGITIDAFNNANDQTFNILLNDGGCQDVWVHGGNAGEVDFVTATEVVPPNYTASYTTTRATIDPAFPNDPLHHLSDPPVGPTAGNSVTVGAGGNPGVQPGYLIEFTNTFSPPPGGCTFTKGWYRNHATGTAAKVAALGGSITVGGQSLNAAQVQAIMDATPGKPGSITFTSNLLLNATQQLIAAILNGGLTGPASIQTAIATANAHIVIAANKTAISVTPSDYDVSGLVTTLTDFNEGTLPGFPHCPETP